MPEDAAVLKWLAAMMRAYQHACGELDHADATDALIAVLQQDLAERRRATEIAAAFAAESDEP